MNKISSTIITFLLSSFSLISMAASVAGSVPSSDDDNLTTIISNILAGKYAESSDINGDGLVSIADATHCIANLSTVDNQPKRAIAIRSQMGNSMGDIPENAPSSQHYYIYDSGNRLVRMITQSVNLESKTEWQPNTYRKYEYDNNGRLVSEYSFSNVYGTSLLNAQNDAINYEYNSLGQLIKKTEDKPWKEYVYDYDSHGHLVNEKRYTIGSNTCDYSITYSDFIDAGPQTLSSEGKYNANIYSGIITYDEDGNKLSESHYDKMGILVSLENWTYTTDGILSLYEKKKYSSGKEMTHTKTEYTVIDADNIYDKPYNYNYSNGKWTSSAGTGYINTFTDFNGSLAPALQSVEANSDNSTVTLSFSTSSETPDDASFHVYRNGLCVDTVYYEPGESNYTCTDNDVPNGTYEYLVQTFVGNTPKNASKILDATLDRTFPKVTSLHAVSARVEKNLYYVTLAWDNPEITPDMKFEYYDVMSVGKYYTVSLFDEENPLVSPEKNTIEVCFSIDTELTLFIKAVFKSGSSSSEAVTINAIDFLR